MPYEPDLLEEINNVSNAMKSFLKLMTLKHNG
jgi:hypothetical protein